MHLGDDCIVKDKRYSIEVEVPEGPWVILKTQVMEKLKFILQTVILFPSPR